MPANLLMAHALFYIFLAWVCAAVVMSWISLAVSADSISALLPAAIRASVPAMWFVPALILLTIPMPALIAAGLLLIANTMRVLVGRSIPSSVAERILAAGQTLPSIAGAFAVQFGVWAILAGYPLAAAGLFSAGAGVWTISSVARGLYELQKGRTLTHAISTAGLTLILTTLLSAGAFAMEAGAGDESSLDQASLFQTTQRLLQGLTRTPKPKLQDPKQTVTPLAEREQDLAASGKSGVPGVVLRPDRERRQNHIFLAAGAAQVFLRTRLTIPFTGEYHLYLTSSRHIPPDAVIHHGSPLDETYLANSGAIMETEAYQALTPPIDFRECGKVLLGISSGERTPASASMHLVTAGLDVDLGSEIFGLDPAAKEILEFKVPASTHSVMVTAIRVLFRRNPVQQDQSTKVAIEQFTLVPAGR